MTLPADLTRGLNQRQVRSLAGMPAARRQAAAKNYRVQKAGVVAPVRRAPVVRRARASTPAARRPAPRAKAAARTAAPRSAAVPNSDAFSAAVPPQDTSTSRAADVSGGLVETITTSSGIVVSSSGREDADFYVASGPLPAEYLSAAAKYPTVLVFCPMPGPIAYRKYSPVLRKDVSTGAISVVGIQAEDYGIAALGGKTDYSSIAGGKATARSLADFDGSMILESKPAKFSFRLRNTTPQLSQGGVVKQLRLASGYECPVWKGGNLTTHSGDDGSSYDYYYKMVSWGEGGLAAYNDFLTFVQESASLRCSSGSDFVSTRQGNTTACDQVRAATFRDTDSVETSTASALTACYGSARRSDPSQASELPKTALALYTFRTALLEGTVSPSFDLSWTQEEVRMNFLGGQAFPIGTGTWPNFGNIGYTVDPTELIGLEMRFPASGGDTYRVADVSPTVPDQSGLVNFVFTSTPPPPPSSSKGLSPVGAGWDNIDITLLMSTDPSKLLGLRYSDNLTEITYFITNASSLGIEAVEDQPGIESLDLLDSKPLPDPYTANLLSPAHTPFVIILGTVATAMDVPYAVNSYEFSVRDMQFARFRPGTLLGNSMRLQPANPEALRKMRNQEERKGSALVKVAENVAAFGLRALKQAFFPGF